MASNSYSRTSESVSEGHPDKLCDQISDAVLDFYLRLEKDDAEDVRVACECLATKNLVVVAGEFRRPGGERGDERDRVEEVVRGVVSDVARDPSFAQEYLQPGDLKICYQMVPQSAEIARGVDDGGAGDQGLMFGYAVDETPELMPAPIHYSHAILRAIHDRREAGELPNIGPDGKAQLTLSYRDGKPYRVDTIVLSHQHVCGMDQDEVAALLKPVVEGALPEGWLDGDTTWHVNPSGSFVQGGPQCDAGLTGRKIIVDTYGGAAPHGGGAFSGKDATKVDRSGAYAARYLAKNVVAAGLAERCTLQIAYAIGEREPVALEVDSHGTGEHADAELAAAVEGAMDLTPGGIRKHLDLHRPIFRSTASYGHFGREPNDQGDFSWERTDLGDELRAGLKRSV